MTTDLFFKLLFGGWLLAIVSLVAVFVWQCRKVGKQIDEDRDL